MKSASLRPRRGDAEKLRGRAVARLKIEHRTVTRPGDGGNSAVEIRGDRARRSAFGSNDVEQLKPERAVLYVAAAETDPFAVGRPARARIRAGVVIKLARFAAAVSAGDVNVAPTAVIGFRRRVGCVRNMPSVR